MGTASTVASAITGSANSATTGAAANPKPAATTSSATSLASNFTTFLNLLTTQLQHQDPTNPTDSNQFTQQLVEFAGVQQQVDQNTKLSSILAALQGNQVSSASSFIGTTVQATGNEGALTNGKTDFGYTLASAASKATVTITDSTGKVVFTGNGPLAAGANTVEWDGQNSLSGVTEPDGIYTISVKATDINGNAVTATPFITGSVTSASISNGTVMLNIGALQFPETNVTSVTNLAAKTTTTTSTTSTGSTSGSTGTSS